MNRRLLRDGRIVDDEWRYLGEGEDEAPLILTLEQWQSRREHWLSLRRRLGVVLLPAHDAAQLRPDLSRLALIAAHFPGPADGRGYSQARMLRENWAFAGELRASGYVRRDQLFFLARCGFNSFEMAAQDLAGAAAALSTFSRAYQPSNDAGLPLTLQHR